MKQYPYKSYIFRTSDPIIEAIRPYLTTKSLARESGVSATTLYNWRKRKTRRPQFATISAVAIAAGCYGITFGTDGQPSFQREPLRKRLKVVK